MLVIAKQSQQPQCLLNQQYSSRLATIVRQSRHHGRRPLPLRTTGRSLHEQIGKGARAGGACRPCGASASSTASARRRRCRPTGCCRSAASSSRGPRPASTSLRHLRARCSTDIHAASLRAARRPHRRHDRQRHAGARHAPAIRARHQRAAWPQHLHGAAGLPLAGGPRRARRAAAVGLLRRGHAGRHVRAAVHVAPARQGVHGVHQRRRRGPAGARIQLGPRAAGLRRAGRGPAAVPPARSGAGAGRTPARRALQRLRRAARRPAAAPRDLPAGDAHRACAVAGRRGHHEWLHRGPDPGADAPSPSPATRSQSSHPPTSGCCTRWRCSA